MGLDNVEVFMAAEEAFGVSIDDLEAERFQTIGDVSRLVPSSKAR